MSSKSSQVPDNTVFFCLARGYLGIQKHQYKKIVLRNIFLNKFLSSRRRIHSVIFHEGNISELDQFFIRLFSFNFKIRFISIKASWTLPNDLIWDGGSEFGLGYSLMCRFHYSAWWKYFDDFNFAARVDDDVLLIDAGNLNDFVYKCAKLYPETHAATNSSFPAYLATLGMENKYNHEFPPNCFYITDLTFWRRIEVSNFLARVAQQPRSLNDRWGDTVVMGVALNIFASPQDFKVDSGIEYMHLSHSLHIKYGEESYGDKNRLLIYISAFFRLIKNR